MTYRSKTICGHGTWLLALVATACTGSTIELETNDSGSTGETNTSPQPTLPDTTNADGGSSEGPGPTERQVDIIFVIDNSGSMGDEQAMIAANLDALVDTLDGAQPPVDYRIAVTTTDNGNPWCQGTGPEARREWLPRAADWLRGWAAREPVLE